MNREFKDDMTPVISNDGVEHFKNFFEMFNMPMAIVSLSGTIVKTNKTFCELLQYEENELVNMNFTQFTHPADIENDLNLLKQLVHGKLNSIKDEKRFRKKNGEIFWGKISLTLLRDSFGNPKFVAGTVEDITAAKQAEINLKESEERYKYLAENIVDVVWILDVSTLKYSYVSPSVFNLRGYTSEEVMQQPFEQVVAPESLKMIQESLPIRIKSYLEGNPDMPAAYEVLQPCKDGSTVITEVTTSLVGDVKTGLQIFGVSRNITDRKKTENALIKSEEKYRRFFDDDLTGDFVASVDGKILMCNDAFVKILKYGSKEELLNKNSFELYWEFQNRTDFLKELKEKKKIINVELTLKACDGSKVYVVENVLGIFDDQGELKEITGYMFDITARKKAEEQILLLSRAMDKSPVTIMLTNEEGNIEYINSKFTELTGYTFEEVKGQNPRILKSGEKSEQEYKSLWETIKSGKEWKGEFHNKKKNGELYWESANIVPIINGKTFFLALKEDITERRKMLQDLIDAKEKAEAANKLKDAFINNMSHEIRTPLSGILGLSSLFKENYARYIETEDEPLFDGIDKSAQRIIRTVDMILNYSRLQTGDYSKVNKEIELAAICKPIIDQNKSAAQNKNLELLFENKSSGAKVIGDEFSITQAISNLVDNAIKYTNNGFAKVTLSSNDKTGIVLEITDTGIGISDEYLTHLFEPFRQEDMGYGRSYEGVGLGLVLTKKYIELNEASLTAVSKKGVGTTFTIEFKNLVQPESVKPIKIETMENVKRPEPKKDAVILIVEDDLINQDVLRRMLDRKYKSLVADSAEGVYNVLQNYRVDLILMDISIHGSKNGLELTKELKAIEAYLHVPVIAVTAHSFPEDRRNALAAGCDDYIAKPFSFEKLFEKIAKYVSI
ncbi:MAG: PAS domain S-box protein [Ignavibacteria bacterium]|nr:PAS domain S-box protein [Ignavibacteria bacterium]